MSRHIHDGYTHARIRGGRRTGDEVFAKKVGAAGSIRGRGARFSSFFRPDARAFDADTFFLLGCGVRAGGGGGAAVWTGGGGGRSDEEEREGEGAAGVPVRSDGLVSRKFKRFLLVTTASARRPPDGHGRGTDSAEEGADERADEGADGGRTAADGRTSGRKIRRWATPSHFCRPCLLSRRPLFPPSLWRQPRVPKRRLRESGMSRIYR